MKAPVISIMIPCYNSGSTLARALKSVLAQTFQDWEALIVDDGSTDNTQQVIAGFKDPRFRYFHLPQNQGRASARQVALNEMKGQYLTMLDADDWIVPDKLLRQINVLLSHPEVALVSSAMFVEASSGGLKGLLQFTYDKNLNINPPLKAPRPLPIPHAPILVRASVLKDRSYDKNLNYSEDLDFFLPILLKNNFAIMSEPLYVYTLESNRSHSKFSAQMKAHRYIFKKYITTFPTHALCRILLTYPKVFVSTLTSLMSPSQMSERGILPATPNEKKIYDDAVLVVSGISTTGAAAPTEA